VFLKLIDGIDRLVDVVDFLLGGINDATDEDQLVVLDLAFVLSAF